MNSNEWNSVTVEDDEKPRVNMEDLRELAADIDPEDFDDDVQNFLEELMQAQNTDELSRAATLLLQDEIDFSPDMAEYGIEPDTDLIALLIACGADVNALNPYGKTPLHVAAGHGYVPVVEMLLAAGAKVTTLSHDGKFAVDCTDDETLKKMLALPNPLDDSATLPAEMAELMREAQGNNCTCGHDHACDCHHGEDCTCGQEHTCHCQDGEDCTCGGKH